MLIRNKIKLPITNTLVIFIELSRALEKSSKICGPMILTSVYFSKISNFAGLMVASAFFAIFRYQSATSFDFAIIPNG